MLVAQSVNPWEKVEEMVISINYQLILGLWIFPHTKYSPDSFLHFRGEIVKLVK